MDFLSGIVSYYDRVKMMLDYTSTQSDKQELQRDIFIKSIIIIIIPLLLLLLILNPFHKAINHCEIKL